MSAGMTLRERMESIDSLAKSNDYHAFDWGSVRALATALVDNTTLKSSPNRVRVMACRLAVGALRKLQEMGRSPSAREAYRDLCRSILELKGEDYSGDKKANANFDTIAAMSGMTRYQVWLVFFCKHFHSYNQYQKGKEMVAESIDLRIVDMANYLYILATMIEEDFIPRDQWGVSE